MDIGLATGRAGVRRDDPGPGRTGLVVRAAAGMIGVAGLALAAGFVWFVAALPRKEPPYLPRGDAIVALTGGTDRIPDAVGWLAQGRGARLLISGVNAQITLEDLAHKSPPLRNWLACCVDIDHAAQNTVGNARETRRWALERGYRSLVVVTSSYHMPRALLELRRHMPGVEMIAAPVVTSRLQGQKVWTDLSMLRLLGQEYGKFLVAAVRARLTRPASLDDITATTTPRRA